MSTCAVYVTACVPMTVPEQFVSFLAGIFAFNGTENDPPNSLSGSFTVSENVTITVVLAVSSTALPFAGETRKSYDCPFEHTAVMGTDVGAETGSAAATTAELPTKITARLSTVTLQRNLVMCCPPSSVRPSDGTLPCHASASQRSVTWPVDTTLRKSLKPVSGSNTDTTTTRPV